MHHPDFTVKVKMASVGVRRQPRVRRAARWRTNQERRKSQRKSTPLFHGVKHRMSDIPRRAHLSSSPNAPPNTGRAPADRISALFSRRVGTENQLPGLVGTNAGWSRPAPMDFAQHNHIVSVTALAHRARNASRQFPLPADREGQQRGPESEKQTSNFSIVPNFCRAQFLSIPISC